MFCIVLEVGFNIHHIHKHACFSKVPDVMIRGATRIQAPSRFLASDVPDHPWFVHRPLRLEMLSDDLNDIESHGMQRTISLMMDMHGLLDFVAGSLWDSIGRVH